MAKIADLTGHADASANYSVSPTSASGFLSDTSCQAIASDYVTRFQDLAKSADEPHLTLSYNNATSWGLTYNLFGDKLLKLNLFPESLYESRKHIVSVA